MRLSSYFDYPEGEVESDADLVFLSGWSDEQWERLFAYTETRRFRAGDVIIRKGEIERALYIVAAGTLEAVVGGGRRRTRIDAGSLVGEVAFFDGAPRSADVRALDDGELLRLTFTDFERFAARHGDLGRALLLDLGRLLATRLRSTQALVR